MNRCLVVLLISLLSLVSRAQSVAQEHEPQGQSVQVEMWIRTNGLDIPSLDAVVAVNAELYNHPMGLPDVDRFTVPKESISKILEQLRPARSQKHISIPESEIGLIQMRLKGGRTQSLPIYWAGKRPLMFGYNGVRMAVPPERGKDIDGALVFDAIIRKMCEQVTQKSDLFRVRN